MCSKPGKGRPGTIHHAKAIYQIIWIRHSLQASIASTHRHVHSVKKLYGFLSNFLFVIFKLDSYFLFKLKCYFLYFTLYVHSMPKLRIHFRLLLIIYWFISLHTCCYLARILRCSLLQWIYSNTLPKK